MSTTRRKRINHRWSNAITQIALLAADIAQEEYLSEGKLREKRTKFRRRVGRMMAEKIEAVLLDQTGGAFAEGAQAVLRFISENVHVRSGQVHFNTKLKGWENLK